MSDLRKAAEMALEALRNAEVVYMEQLNAMYALQGALAQPEQESFIVDRGCWERGCMAYDCRDADAVTIEAKLKENK